MLRPPHGQALPDGGHASPQAPTVNVAKHTWPVTGNIGGPAIVNALTLVVASAYANFLTAHPPSSSFEYLPLTPHRQQ